MVGLFHAALPVSAGIVRGRTFVNCQLLGPAVLLAGEGVQLNECHLGDSQGDIRNLLFRPLSTQRMIGPIGFEHCTFQACAFAAVGYTGSDDFLDMIIASTPTGRADTRRTNG